MGVCRCKPVPDVPLLQPGHRADRPGTGRQGVPVCGGGSMQTHFYTHTPNLIGTHGLIAVIFYLTTCITLEQFGQII